MKHHQWNSLSHPDLRPAPLLPWKQLGHEGRWNSSLDPYSYGPRRQALMPCVSEGKEKICASSQLGAAYMGLKP